LDFQFDLKSFLKEIETSLDLDAVDTDGKVFRVEKGQENRKKMRIGFFLAWSNHFLMFFFSCVNLPRSG
jgi:hypothetical protein